jgi:hypothetical protein
MLAVPSDEVEWQSITLDGLGASAWDWVNAIDATTVSVTDPRTLEAYRKHAEKHKQKTENLTDADKTIDDDKNIAQLSHWEGLAGKHAKRMPAEIKADGVALRAKRADVIARSSPLEIQAQTQHAGLPLVEQLDWILDKPGLTPAQLREVTLVMTTDMILFTDPVVAKLQRRFPKVPVEELFTGRLSGTLLVDAAVNTTTAKWLLANAQPETILRIVTGSTPMIDAWCTQLVATGVGFGWVRELGGFHNDRLLRQFVLQCPDAPTREYIESRLLGDADLDHGRHGGSITAPKRDPGAYATSRNRLDADLDRAAKTTDKDKVSDTISDDVAELSAKELAELRRDAKRLKQVLATANKVTFPQILEHVGPELQVALVYATRANIKPAHLIAWAQARPAHEILAVLSTPSLVERIRAIVGLGPLELFPSSATPAVLGPALVNNRDLIEWLLQSDPTAVLHAIVQTPVIDAAVAALRTLDDVTVLEKAWPSAAALGAFGQTAYVQLAARAKGALREVLDAKLKTELPKPNDDEDLESADKSAVTLHDKRPFVERAEELLDNEAPSATVLALCRAEPGAWSELAKKPTLADRLGDRVEVPPDLAFSGIKLSTLLGSRALHRWILKATPAFKVLGAIGPGEENIAAIMFDERSEGARKFFDEVPRGRALPAGNKATLHRVSRLATKLQTVEELFEVAFDVRVTNFARPELEKLWSTLELVPEAHVDQQSISRLRGMAGNSDTGTAGVYRPETREIEIQKNRLGVKERNQYDQYSRMTEAEVIEALGSKEAVDRFVADGLMVKAADGTYSYVQVQPFESLPHTILHEVGHAVDYMLGASTELVYGLAGWKRFNSSDFDSFAAQLGGWNDVTEPDKAEIRKVWVSWIHGGGKDPIADMVRHDHPAVATRYGHVGVVKLARLGLDLMGRHTLFDGQYIMGSFVKQTFYTLTPKGHNAAPSAYSLTAPEEYFAECYANYYREYDGTPATGGKKGATLAPWIKTWFDTNIDNVGHNPRRHDPKGSSP